jgi:hypothetical protein
MSHLAQRKEEGFKPAETLACDLCVKHTTEITSQNNKKHTTEIASQNNKGLHGYDQPCSTMVTLLHKAGES